MTAEDLKDILASAGFKHDLQEISCYLASIMQERPVVYAVAKCLWKMGIRYVLEDDARDLLVGETHVEFKFNFVTCHETLAKELKEGNDDLKAICAAHRGNNWHVVPKIYRDVCEKKPHLFVWVICSRDLSSVSDDDLKRIKQGKRAQEHCIAHLYNPDGGHLTEVDRFLSLMQRETPFTFFERLDIQTEGFFPSTYHFRICGIGR